MTSPDRSFTLPLIAYRQREKTDLGAQVCPDTLLQASQRLDWRFLLPAPELGQVAYIGPARGRLLKSLRLLSASVTVIDMGGPTGNGTSPAQHDVVVLGDPTASALRRAVEVLRPGGWLYMEAYGPFSHQGLRRCARRLRFVHDYAATLQQFSMGEIAAHWHWPDFESRTRIIPLGDQTALSYVFAQPQSSAGARLMATLGNWLRRRGLLTLVVPCFSIIARRREPQINSNP